jgi:adenylate cyclase
VGGNYGDAVAVSRHERQRELGRQAVAAMRQVAAEQVAAALKRRDPEMLERLIDQGVVRREWVDHPGAGPISDATPFEALVRAFGGVAEQHPSFLSSLGMSTLELLSATATTPEPAVRNTVVAFTDLEGFTHYTEREGDSAAASLLADHYRRAGRVVRGRGGRIVKHLGDGMLMTFPEPSGAVLAAVELVEQGPAPLRVRAGLHSGDVVVEGDDLVGHVVNVAARVTDSAKGGQVLITENVRDALSPDDVPQLSIGRSRARPLKGVDERVGICPVTRV